jgi:hypothetical protein
MAAIPTFVFFNAFDPTVLDDYSGAAAGTTELLEAVERAYNAIKMELAPIFANYDDVPISKASYVSVQDNVFRVELVMLPSEHHAPGAYLYSRPGSEALRRNACRPSGPFWCLPKFFAQT